MWFDLMKLGNGLNLFSSALSKGVFQMNKFTSQIWEQVLDNLLMCLVFPSTTLVSVILPIRSAEEMNPYVVQLEETRSHGDGKYAHRFKSGMNYLLSSWQPLPSFGQNINMKWRIDV